MPHDKLTPADRAARDREIARLVNEAGVSTRDVGERFGLSAMSISRIASKARSGTIPPPAHAVAPVEIPPAADPEPPAALVSAPDAPIPEGHAALLARLKAAQHGRDPAPALDLPPLPDDASSAEQMARAIKELQHEAAVAREQGNPKLAGQLLKTIASLMPGLARAEREAREANGGEIRMTRDEWRLAEAGVREKLDALASRPLLCAACSRELSILWGDCADKIAEIDAADAFAEEGRKK
jgi:hypothetical protein